MRRRLLLWLVRRVQMRNQLIQRWGEMFFVDVYGCVWKLTPTERSDQPLSISLLEH